MGGELVLVDDKYEKLIDSITTPLKEDWVAHNDTYVKSKSKPALKARDTRRKKQKPKLSDIRIRLCEISNELLQIVSFLQDFDGGDE